MGASIRVAIVGDRDDSIPAHRAIPLALDLAATSASTPLRFDWIATADVHSAEALDEYGAVWCVPGSPYRNMDGALLAIRAARERGCPFLGTCGGFQHAVIEVARHVIGWADADHAETGGGDRLVIDRLACPLREASETLRAVSGSRLAAAYGASSFDETYRCSFGIAPRFFEALAGAHGPFAPAATSSDGEVRALELRRHPFFVGTLFQPERAALAGRVPPLVAAFVAAAARAGEC